VISARAPRSTLELPGRGTRSRSTTSASHRTSGRSRTNFTLNYGLRYDYYTPLQERDNRIVKFNIETGQLDPDTTPFYSRRRTISSLACRHICRYLEDDTSRRLRHLRRPGTDGGPDSAGRAERISTTLSSGPFLAYPIDPEAIRANFNNPNNRSYQPRAYSGDYILPERVYQYTASVQQELAGAVTVTAAYVGSQGRNLFLRSIANRQ
jgi:hypothetical protein